MIYQAYNYASQQMNVTAGFNTSYSMLPVIGVLAVALALVALLFYAGSSIERFRKFKRLTRVFKFLYKSTSYAAYGLLTVVIIVAPCLLAYHGIKTAQANTESILPLMKWVGIAVGAYVGFAVLGWFMKKKVWSKLSKYHKQDKLLKSYKEQMKELPVKEI